MSEVLAACWGEAGAHQLLHKSSQLLSRGRWLNLLSLSQCKQAQTRSLRPLGSSKKMEIMHFDFILGAVCLGLGMAAVNQPKALPCMAWEMLVGHPSCTHPAQPPPPSVPAAFPAWVPSPRKSFSVPGDDDGEIFSGAPHCPCKVAGMGPTPQDLVLWAQSTVPGRVLGPQGSFLAPSGR